MKWLRHVLRTSDDDPLRQVSFEPTTANRVNYGKRLCGRPRQNWLNYAKKNRSGWSCVETTIQVSVFVMQPWTEISFFVRPRLCQDLASLDVAWLPDMAVKNPKMQWERGRVIQQNNWVHETHMRTRHRNEDEARDMVTLMIQRNIMVAPTNLLTQLNVITQYRSSWWALQIISHYRFNKNNVR